uniref:Ribonuclease P protein subunit p29 n=1 Tax=Rhipicephalus zambeziensis TaxID=60191 RepID=A0A224Z5S3_9ACAR
MTDSACASDGAVQNVYLTTKEIKYDPPLPAQAVNYVRNFIERHAGQQQPGEVDVLARYTAVLEPDIARKKKGGDQKSRRGKLLTCREKRQLGMFNVHKDNKLSYASFVPIHLMWKDYFRGLVRDEVTEYSRLLKAEYTGCFLTVAESRCPSYVGARGIVVQETKNVFRLLTEQNVVRTVPKANSAFAFELDGRIYKIYGSHFRVHSFERMKAKFKARGVVGL